MRHFPAKRAPARLHGLEFSRDGDRLTAGAIVLIACSFFALGLALGALGASYADLRAHRAPPAQLGGDAP